MLEKFQNHIQSQFSFLNESKIFIAVSGGVDSMVLVDLYQKLQLNFSILHCNFQLRGEESEAETQFIRDFGKKNQIPYIIHYFETEKYAKENKLSIQLAARKLRYNWFQDELKNKNFNHLLTAHHADDNLETFLINLSRGTGIEGLTGIPKQNNFIIRPLLPFSRTEILQYAKENQVEWKEDSSNQSDKYLRNKIRHQIVPILKELHPTFLDNFEKTQFFLQQNQQFVENTSNEVYEQVVHNFKNRIEIDSIKLLQFKTWKTLLYQWLKPYNFSAWNDIYDLITAQSGKQIFTDKYTLLKDRSNLILYETNSSKEIYLIEKEIKNLKLPLKLSFEQVNYSENHNRNAIFVDQEKLDFPLTLRKRVEGDVFYPNRMKGTKKVSKFFKDEKYSLLDKENQWLLTSNNEIVWVIGKRADRRFLADETTQHIIKIELSE